MPFYSSCYITIKINHPHNPRPLLATYIETCLHAFQVWLTATIREKIYVSGARGLVRRLAAAFCLGAMTMMHCQINKEIKEKVCQQAAVLPIAVCIKVAIYLQANLHDSEVNYCPAI